MPKGHPFSLFEQKMIYQSFQSYCFNERSFTRKCKAIAALFEISHLSVMRIVRYFQLNGCFKPIGKSSGRKCIWKNETFLKSLQQYLSSQRPTLKMIKEYCEQLLNHSFSSMTIRRMCRYIGAKPLKKPNKLLGQARYSCETVEYKYSHYFPKLGQHIENDTMLIFHDESLIYQH